MDPARDPAPELVAGPAPLLVTAAGGVVWRPRTGPHDVEVLLVHRPRYDDWSLPKGKLDHGETFESAALREIAEETGVHGELGTDLGEVRYTDHRGRPKVVRWWAVRGDAIGTPEDTDEVDEMRWLTPDEAAALLSYPTDAEVLDRFRATLIP
ncbi:NUDIX hydrolase [soil metagenome]